MLFTRLIPSFVYKIGIAVFLLRMVPSLKSNVFTVKSFKEIAAKHVGEDTVESLVINFRQTYGSSIPTNLYWIPFSAGGLNLKAKIIHPGLSEYIAVFAAPIRTSGRSGFHWSNSSCTVLNGEVSRFNDNFVSFTKETFTAGKNFRHGEFDSYIYELEPNTAVVCYGRGVTPVSTIWPAVGAISNVDAIGLLKLGFVGVEAHYKWVAESFFNFWNRNAPKAWKAEL
uniref:Sigma non-opioid intracellular receptor 1 n=1 Tax=Panagrellus redivivus TaxID=6233 RepID=A0A7E4VAQ0_PANRE